MRKPTILFILAAFTISLPAIAAKNKPVEKIEADQIEASLSELSALIHDSSLKSKTGKTAMLEDFREDLQLSNNAATLTTDDFARKGGLQETPAPSAEATLE